MGFVEATTIGVRNARAKRLNGTRRHVFLLPGLLSCGCCQGKCGIISKDRYGCLNHFRRGSCSNRDGMYESTMKARMREFQLQKADIGARLNAAAAPEPLDVNPNIANLYGREVQRLTDALADNQTHQEAAAALRSLIGDVVLMPGERRGKVNATLRGELMGILDCANGGNTPRTIVITKGAAGPRNHLYRTDQECFPQEG